MGDKMLLLSTQLRGSTVPFSPLRCLLEGHRSEHLEKRDLKMMIFLKILFLSLPKIVLVESVNTKSFIFIRTQMCLYFYSDMHFRKAFVLYRHSENSQHLCGSSSLPANFCYL